MTDTYAEIRADSYMRAHADEFCAYQREGFGGGECGAVKSTEERYCPECTELDEAEDDD